MDTLTISWKNNALTATSVNIYVYKEGDARPEYPEMGFVNGETSHQIYLPNLQAGDYVCEIVPVVEFNSKVIMSGESSVVQFTVSE